MSIIHKYIIKEVGKYFSIVLSLVIGIFVAVDYLGTMDEFIDAQISLIRAFTWVLLRIPFMTTQFIPIALLLAVLITFGLMTRNNEMLIIKSSGKSLFYVIRPVILTGIVCSAIVLFLSESIVPITMAHANRIKYKEIRKESAVVTEKKNIWIKGNRVINHVKYYNPANLTVMGITRYFFNTDFRMIRRIDAEKGVYKEGKWLLDNATDQILDVNNGKYDIVFHEKKTEPLDFSPVDLQRIVKKPEEMNFSELAEYIKKVETEGYDATLYRVNLYAKTAFPFACLIMCFAGAGLAGGGRFGKGLALSITYGIGIAFLYWIFYSFCLSLGYGEMLPPIVSAWIANLVFLCVGIFLLLNAE